MNLLDFLDNLENDIPAFDRRIIRDRNNPFDIYDDISFKRRYRFSKQGAMFIVDLLREDITMRTHKNNPVAPEIQVSFYFN